MKFNLLVICLFSSILLNAQIKKGALFIGGDIGLYGYTYKTTNPNQATSVNNSYNFSPSLGWAVKDNVIVGGRILLSFFNNEQQPIQNSEKGNHIGGGIYMRKYLPLGKSFYLFGDAGLNAQSIYRSQTSLPPSYYYKEKGYAINASIFPGVSYQIKRKLFLELALNNLISIGYERKNIEEKNLNGNNYKGSTTSYNLYSSLGNGVPLQIGMRYMFGKK